MKKFTIILALLFPMMLFAQHQISVAPNEPASLKVAIPAYNDRIPAAIINMIFEFDPSNETLLVRMGSGGMASPNYDKVWLPQHEIVHREMASYTNARGVTLKKAKTFVDQENFLNLVNKPVLASVDADGMTFTGVYDLQNPTKKKVKKELDKQMVPLDGIMELRLAFNVAPRTKNVVLTLHNPMPMHRSGKKGVVDFMADDVIINIELDRCSESQELLATIDEYVNIFEIGEQHLAEMQKSSRSLMPKVVTLLLEQYGAIDIKRFENTGCAEVESLVEQLETTIEHIREYNRPKTTTNSQKQETTSCDVKKLNAEIKSTTSKLNNLVNDWSLASDAATKAEKKNAFESVVNAFDDKLNSLPNGCKSKLDAKLLKNYEFVKKLVK